MADRLLRIKMKAMLRIGLILMAGIGSTFSAKIASSDIQENSTVVAAIVLNLARFTEWPPTIWVKPDDKLRLCVLGDNLIHDAFGQIDSKQVGSRSLSVIHLARLKNTEQCHLLYVSALDRGTVIQLLTELRGHPVLTISSDDDNFLEDGGVVMLRLMEGKMNISVNLKNADREGIKISSRVLQLATIVDR